MRAFCRTVLMALLLAATLSAQQRGRSGATAPPAPPRPAPQAPAAPPQQAPRRNEIAVPFHVGETLTYDVAWSQYLVAGTAVSRVVEKRPSYNSTAYYIVAEGRPL